MPTDTTRTSRWSAWFALMRLSNLPTVWTNVLVGSALAAPIADWHWLRLLFCMVGLSLLYVMGMAHNDLTDRVMDKTDNPKRPLPSGQLSIKAVQYFIVICTAIAVAILGLLAVDPQQGFHFSILWPVLGLLACITAYNLFHKRLTLAIAFMAGARALVYVVAAMVQTPDHWPIHLPAVALAAALYITATTLIARREGEPAMSSDRWYLPAIYLATLAPLAIAPATDWLLAAVFTGIAIAWLLRITATAWRKPDQSRTVVMSLLAGICLFDAALLAMWNAPLGAGLALIAFFLTTRLHRRIAGT